MANSLSSYVLHGLRRSTPVILVCSLSIAQAQPAKAAHSQKEMSSQDRETLRIALDAYDQGDAAKAEPLLRDLTKRYPGSYEANEALGSLFAESGKLEEALPYLRHSCELAPRQALAHANLGAAYLKLGEAPPAVTELRKAVTLDPTQRGHSIQPRSGTDACPRSAVCCQRIRRSRGTHARGSGARIQSRARSLRERLLPRSCNDSRADPFRANE